MKTFLLSLQPLADFFNSVSRILHYFTKSTSRKTIKTIIKTWSSLVIVLIISPLQLLTSSGGTSFQSRHYPEHCQSCGNCPWCAWAMLCSRQDEPPQRPLPGSKQEHGAKGLPKHVCGYMRLPVGPLHEPLETVINEDRRQWIQRKCSFSA